MEVSVVIEREGCWEKGTVLKEYYKGSHWDIGRREWFCRIVKLWCGQWWWP